MFVCDSDLCAYMSVTLSWSVSAALLKFVELIQSILNSDFGRLSNGLNHRYIAFEVQVNALENPRSFMCIYSTDGESADACMISPDGINIV